MPKIGVFVCHCGSNIAGTVDVEKVAAAARTIPGVVVACDYRYMCSEAGQETITKAIREYGLDGVVVCSCSPRMHEATFAGRRSGKGSTPIWWKLPTPGTVFLDSQKPGRSDR